MISYIKYIWDGSLKVFLGFNVICLIFIFVWIVRDGWQGDVIVSTEWLAGTLGFIWVVWLVGDYFAWKKYKQTGS